MRVPPPSGTHRTGTGAWRRRLSRAGTVAGLAAALLATAAAPAHADRIRTQQWQLTALHASAAWRYGSGAGVIVAVLDSGVDARHPDLVGQVLPGADFVDGSTDGRTDPVGHGTTVAALIAGRGDDAAGVEGLAPQARILPVRVLDRQNRYADAAVVAHGVRWAVDHGARVINLSLGGGTRSAVLALALGYAAAHDVVVVACTGNTTTDATVTPQVWYPAREPGVVAVAGLTPTRAGPAAPLTAWSGSLTGPATVLSAPAAVLTGARPGGYWQVQGTSFAAPLVAATAALVRGYRPDLDAANVVNRLIRTGTDLGPPGRDGSYGYGEVDPVAALTAAVPPVTANPLLDVPGPVAGEAQQATASGGGGPVPTVQVAVPADRGRRSALLPPAWTWWLAGGVAMLGAALALRRRTVPAR